MNDQIKLAEAMGWVPCADFDDGMDDIWADPDNCYHDKLPDPFIDANADYAVLQWVDDNFPRGSNEFIRFTELLQPAWLYEIGDFARAALKVLE